MATIARTQTAASRDQSFAAGSYASDRAFIITWALLTAADDGDIAHLGDYADRSVQVEGTFGGATCVLEGSNDGTNYHTLTDGEGNALSFTIAGLQWIKEAVAFMRPRTSGGNGTTSLTVSVFARG